MKRSHRVAQVSEPRTLEIAERETRFQRAHGRTSAHRDHAIAESRGGGCTDEIRQVNFRIVLTMTEERDAHQ